MAKNIILQPGWSQSVVVTDPATPESGDAVRCGAATGLALTDEGEGGNETTETTVYFGPGVFDIPVVAEASAIEVWDTLFYDDAIDGVNNDAVNGYFYGFALEAIGNGETDTIKVFHVPSPGAGTLADGAITAGKLADNALSADATGRAKMQDGYFDAATALAKFAADSVANAFLLDAIADGAFQADAGTRALFADGIWTEAKLAAASLTGLVAALVADANVIGGLPVLHRIDIAGGAAGDVDVVLTHKTRVIDVWAVHTGGAGEANDTIQVFNGASAITDAMAWSGADKALVRAAEIDDAAHEIAAAGTLKVTTTDDDAGGDVGAGVVYVLGIRVA